MGETCRLATQHATTDDRLRAMRTFQQTFPELSKAGVVFVAEPIDDGNIVDEFSNAFAPWPTRLLYFKHGDAALTLKYISYFDETACIDFDTYQQYVQRRMH
mgnify:CR=1 FL=1